MTKKLFGIEGVIARKNFNRSKRKYRTTIFSIFLSIVLFISMSSFVDNIFGVSSINVQTSDVNLTSCGAVFMGANTYIGNAPNFMVKSIADENGVRMPSFFGYLLWSLVILVPVFALDMLLFFL